MMNHLMIKMAQRASRDKTLFAALIEASSQRHNKTWEQIAQELNLEMEQLVKLALCKRPRPLMLAQDVMQIVTYVGINKTTLSQFMQQAEGKQSTPIT